MKKICSIVLTLAAIGNAHAGGPYPLFTGINAAADNASTAGMNPAGITRFDTRNTYVEVLATFSENTWEGQLGNGPTFRSDDSSTRVIPSGNVVTPIRDKWWFGFTMLGSGFSDDYGNDWPGRYFMIDYSIVYLSAFPTIAYRVNDKLSLAASLAATYTTYEQNKAVPNDPGLPDGRLNIDADGFSVGGSVSLLYEFSERTRVGLVYRSEISPEMDGTADFSNLGPITEGILGNAGLLGAKVEIKSRQPQAITAGIYHEFGDTGALTFDFAWSEFSDFKLSEIYVNGDQIVEADPSYDDIFAFTVGYNRPIADRWRAGIGVLYVEQMVEDDDRTLALRLDEIWGVGLGLQWRWKSTRIVDFSLSYIEPGEAPVTSPTLPAIGAVTGRYTERYTILLQAGIGFGPGPRRAGWDAGSRTQ